MTKWIKCSERLPDKKDRYLACSDKTIIIAEFLGHTESVIWYWSNSWGANPNVTHWAELPERPE